MTAKEESTYDKLEKKLGEETVSLIYDLILEAINYQEDVYD